MTEIKKILVTAAAGKTGRATIDELLKMGYAVRALVRQHDDRSKQMESQGVEVVVGDLLNFEDMVHTMDGVQTAYFCYPVYIPGLLRATAYFLQATIEKKVKSIVNMSQISARRDAKSNAAQDHWVSERLFDLSGITVTHLRPTFFAEWLLAAAPGVKANHEIRLPFGSGRWAPVSSVDLGQVVARVCAAPEKYAGQILKLYGPKEYDLHEMSAVISEVIGRKVVYVPLTMEEFDESYTKKGFDKHFIQHIENVSQDCINGIFAGTNHVIEEITGRPATSLHDFINTYKAAF